MITISGRTFDHKPLLRSLGARWDDRDKVWRLQRISNADRALIAGTVGLVITGEATPEPDEIDHGDWDTPAQFGDDMTFYNAFADRDPILFFGYSSLAKVLDDADTATPFNPKWTMPWREDEQTAQFSGTRSLFEAIQIARHGWLGALGMADRLLPPAPIRKRRQNAYAGGSVNVGRMLASVPNHMRKMRPMAGHQSITLFVETASWMETTINTLLIRSIAVASIIDRLESEGFRCDVIAVSSACRIDLKPIQWAIRLKDAGERLNLADLSFALGHPSFERRILGAVERMPAQCFKPDSRHSHILRHAFNDDHQPGRNEYYIPAFIERDCSDIWEIIERITPDNLPIKIKEP